MEQFGYTGIEQTTETSFNTRSQIPYTSPGGYTIEPDATAASYFMALPLLAGGSLTVENLSTVTLQGDIAFADVLGSARFHHRPG